MTELFGEEWHYPVRSMLSKKATNTRFCFGSLKRFRKRCAKNGSRWLHEVYLKAAPLSAR